MNEKYNKYPPAYDMHPKSYTLLEVHIFMAKKGQKQKKYSAEFKICGIMDMQ